MTGDEAFEALADERRRRVLTALLEDATAGDGTVDALDVATPGTADPERVRTAMYHNHLPKLEDEGFVRWNRADYAVERGPAFDDVRPLLELLADGDTA